MKRIEIVTQLVSGMLANDYQINIDRDIPLACAIADEIIKQNNKFGQH